MQSQEQQVPSSGADQHIPERHHHTGHATDGTSKQPDPAVVAFLLPNDPTSMQYHSSRRGSLVSQAEERVHSALGSDAEDAYQCMAYMHSQKPLNRRELGRVSWAFLHTVAAYYPQQPSRADQDEIMSFFQRFSRFYPYKPDQLGQATLDMLDATSRDTLQYSLCRVHNVVNEKIGKPIFDCNLVTQRWKTGMPGLCEFVPSQPSSSSPESHQD